MGREFLAKCKKCGAKFNVREGSGKDFYLLHCDTCGKEKIIRQPELDKNVPLIDKSGISYKERVEKYAGKCGEGEFKLKAKARCYNCNSEDYEMVSENGKAKIAFYD